MASAFSITTATNNIPIGKQRSATVLFTVTNTSDQPLIGRALLVMDPPHEEQAAWLRFPPPQKSERHFEVNGVQDFTVEANVPGNAAAGEYLFHLDMVDTENPDESYTAGPAVKLGVVAQKKEEKKPFPWWIIVVALGILAVVIGAFIFWPRSIAVPEEYVDTGTQEQGMHACPVGFAIAGVHLENNLFLCRRVVRSGDENYVMTIFDGAPGTQRNDMHACPEGTYMRGLRADQNNLLCSYDSRRGQPQDWLTEFEDTSSQEYGMHTCPATSRNISFLTGIRVDQDRFLCGIYNP